jgi:hypothetical protein
MARPGATRSERRHTMSELDSIRANAISRIRREIGRAYRDLIDSGMSDDEASLLMEDVVTEAVESEWTAEDLAASA